MGDNDSWGSELDFGSLSLIDVSTEDDSLLVSSFLDPTNDEITGTDKDDRGFRLFGDTNDFDEEILVSTLYDKEGLLQPHQSPELQKMIKSGKYNLRKSLAWDKAFFTGAGVLEPDEISSMIESNRMSERKTLPTIQEDVHRSTESISTLQSDCTIATSQDLVLFEDVKTSIQRSGISSDAVTPDKSKELGATDAAVSPTSSTLEDPVPQETMKSNANPRKPSIRAQGLGKTTKQPVAAREHKTSISRASISRASNTALSKVRSLPTISTKRASVDVNKTNQEKNLKARGKEPLTSRAPKSAPPISSKPVTPFKSALRSSSTSKNELTSSCSSLESLTSASSSSSYKSPLSSVKHKKDQSLRLASHSLGNGSTSRAASRAPLLSASRKSLSRLSSNASHVSSISDTSSESSRVSNPNKMVKGNQKTVPRERRPANDGTTKTSKLPNRSNDVSPAQEGAKGDVVRSASVKPTGLRVPSPKVGYFDGVRSSITRTPMGNIQSSTALVNGLARVRARSSNESDTTTTKPVKSQATRSPLMQESTNSKVNLSRVSRSSRLVPASVSSSSSPKLLLNKRYSKVSAEEQLN